MNVLHTAHSAIIIDSDVQIAAVRVGKRNQGLFDVIVTDRVAISSLISYVCAIALDVCNGAKACAFAVTHLHK